MTITGQPAVTYTYDNGNRLLQIQQGTQTVGFAYDAANRRIQTVLPNGITINYGYDNANQLMAITYTKGANTLGDLSYSYDASGRPLSIGGSFARTILPATIASGSYNVNNQLMQWATQSLAYDLNGNLTSDGTYIYVWNSRNQLAQVKQGTTVIGEFQYDAFGRRKQKTIDNITKQFLYDGQNFVQELDGAGTVTENYIIGLGLDELYTRTQGGTTNSFLTDHLGTIIAEADGTGTVQTRYSYEPYGKTSQMGMPSNNSQRYTGREQEFDSLYYYRARYYSPNTNRFIAEDPITTLSGLNLYGYAGANPISYTDPTGQFWSGIIGGIIIGGVVGGALYAMHECMKKCETNCPLPPPQNEAEEIARDNYISDCRAKCAGAFGELANAMKRPPLRTAPIIPKPVPFPPLNP
jgi:RHS repeat-associated protein